MNSKGILYLVPTPIGNLEDMTFRAVRILKEVKLIGAEDTRKSSILLKHYDIATPVLSYHKFNEKKRTGQWLDLLLNGQDIALITDAGTPGISDPSSLFVKEAIAREISVCCLPGATAFVPALAASGMPIDKFCFLGFMPEKQKEQQDLLERIQTYPETLIFYEAPHNLRKSLDIWLKHLGDRIIVIGREISKVFETYYRGRISDFLGDETELVLKGEFVVLIGGSETAVVTDEEIRHLLRDFRVEGLSRSDSIRRISELTGVKKNRIYDLALKHKSK
ncbi:MAG TPA: 16S rRNA (cytidine(1402)-2'-O)-methyltransferase [Candidatus Cloacimonadota bacterium]|nr:16S rRNA (cytidine(1402)-2'-O)-methyltransferase [Candidatus Cloacimonadota bacterium]HPT71983.1 16S rRNA (cytidine(1402)-2'-O)-methyltransferase [Candidatus Cloacimonadota bacterium]